MKIEPIIALIPPVIGVGLVLLAYEKIFPEKDWRKMKSLQEVI